MRVVANSYSKSFAALASAAVVLVVIFFIMRAPHYLNHDVSWFVMVAGLYMDGAVPYVDFIEPNAPLSWFLMIPASVLNRSLEVPLPYATNIWVLTLVSISYFLSVLFTKNLDLSPTRLFFLQVTIFAIFVLWPGQEFGQREHLLGVFATPYILAVAQRNSPAPKYKWALMLAGVLAAIGAGLKPPVFFALVVVELVSFSRTRSLFHLENIALAGVLAFYVLLTATFFPEFFEINLTWGTGLYSAYGNWFGILPFFVGFLIFTGILFVLTFLYRESPSGQAGWMFGMAAIGAFAGYLLQQKGWLYQAYPFIHFSTVSLALFAVRIDRFWLGACIYIVVISIGLTGYDWRFYLNDPDRHAEFYEVFDPGERALVFSTAVGDAFPFAAIHPGGWGSRYPCLILMPGLVKATIENGGTLPVEYRNIDKMFRSHILQDLIKFSPAKIAIRKEFVQAMPVGFDIEEWLLEDAEFEAVWERYEEISETPRGFRIFQLRAFPN